jgi:hypothetical protein
VACPIIENEAQTRYNAPFFFGGKDGKSTEAYSRHNDWVRSVVPKEKLLEFQPGHGWEPLCKFLQKPVPEGEYPRLNDTAVMEQKLHGRLMKGLTEWAAGMALVAGAVMAWRYRSVIMR